MSSNPEPVWLDLSFNEETEFAAGLRQDYRLFAIAARVALSFTKGGEDPRSELENMVGSGLPGDTHGRLGLDPEPFKGRNLSKNPHPKISPQTMPETKYGTYVEPNYSQDPMSGPRHTPRHIAKLRKLVGY